MEITILGSGTFIPELKRHCSSYLLNVKNQRIIFDFGRGTLDSLIKLNADLYSLDKIFISHIHSDHSAELIDFISFIMCNPEKKKLRNFYTIYGPKGTRKKIRLLMKIFDISKKNIRRLNLKELKSGDIIKYKNIKIKCFNAEHDGPSLAFRIEADKKVICYSGDSAYCKSILEACKNADLAILESTLPKLSTHMGGEDAGKTAKEANVKKLILTHIARSYLNNAKKEARRHYKGKVIIAKDMMKLKIK